jgi:VIT1/CCC1 family predicted Fe2+/Mn2+ transporter
MEVEAPDAPTLARWRHHWQEEVDAAFLYGRLAEGEPVEERRRVYRRLAEVERMHVDAWRQLLVDQRVELAEPKPSLRARGLAWFGQRFGPGMLLGFLRREEGLEVRGYLSLYRDSLPGAPRQTALRLARESASHAETLTELAEAKGEPWHRASSGGFVRNVIYGFNDGLTANFGLVAGVIGAAVHSDVVLLSGIAGMLADALSMGSSGYLAAKSEQEIYAHEIAMEREEIRLMPELEREELSILYQAKGIPEAQASALATQVMADPVKGLEEKVREELRIGEASSTPLREGWVTGIATAFGAFIPVAPLLLSTEPWAIWTSFGVAMLSHFGVGAARSFFTGRGLFRSGFDMFVVGLGVAGVGYLVGDLVAKWLT